MPAYGSNGKLSLMNRNSSAQRAGKTSLGSILGLLAFAVISGLILSQKQQIVDAYRLHNYVPPAAIAQIASDDTFTPQTRRVYYVNKPMIQNKAEFKSECPNGGGEKTIILGCYHGGQGGIYLLQVNDPRLNGVTQVTAAHETLHAAYDRLSGNERKGVDAMLLDYYKTGLKDDRIKKTIEGYKISEPKDVVNEMHSIFGTEVATLPKDLENYYTKYFIDRSKVIGYANQYQAEFTSRQETIKRDDAKLIEIKNQIKDIESNLGARQARISATQQDLLAKKRNGDTGGYNAGVPGYNADIDEYNRQVATAQSLVKQYNQLVSERNAVASEISELSNALSTGATSAEQIPQ